MSPVRRYTLDIAGAVALTVIVACGGGCGFGCGCGFNFFVHLMSCSGLQYAVFLSVTIKLI